jgi:hypothetical protein
MMEGAGKYHDRDGGGMEGAGYYCSQRCRIQE